MRHGLISQDVFLKLLYEFNQLKYTFKVHIFLHNTHY